MRYPIGSCWRVVAADASLESAHGQMHAGGSISTSFRRHTVPPRAVLVAAGTRNIGSDSFTEDVFKTADGAIAGAFRPCICGSALVQALAPLAWACARSTSGAEYGLEVGPALDKIPLADLQANREPTQLRDLIAARFTTADILACCDANYIRARWKIRVELDSATIDRYIDWRECVDRITRATGERVAILIAEIGGRSGPRSAKTFTHPRESIFRRHADLAQAAGMVTYDGADLVLTEQGKRYADEHRGGAADRVVRALLEERSFGEDGYAPRHWRGAPIERIVAQDDVRHALALGLAALGGGVVTLTAAGRDRGDWLSFNFTI
jgi:hypothetical protein